MQVADLKGKVFEERPGFPTQYGPYRTDKKPGHPFFPHEVYRDLVIIFLMTSFLFFLSAVGPPALGEAGNPFVQPFIIPDWYLLWSWGLLKIAEVIPPVEIFGIPLTGAFYGTFLSGIPFLALILLPFIDKGFEARPVKAPLRSSIGIAAIIWVFGASLYAINNVVLLAFPAMMDDDLKLWFVVPPILGGAATYVALRRLAFKPMKRVNSAASGASFLILLLFILIAFVAQPMARGIDAVSSLSQPRELYLAIYLSILAVTSFAIFFALTYLEEVKAKQFLLLFIVSILVILAAMTNYLSNTDKATVGHVLGALAANSHALVGLPVFSIVVAYLGLRTPYSDYEFKLNECYQCGRCHLVCPITKVEVDALGGLNLVYNVYKRQHDGVPMWSCLTCDACSAVCPLDINYSAYVLTERARATGRIAADGGVPIGKR